MSIEFLDHTGDIGVRIEAPDPPRLVEEAARAFYAILLEEGTRERVEPREERRVDLRAQDGEEALVDFLQELIYRFDAERLLLPLVEVEEARLQRGGACLRARLEGERFDPARHALRTEVKAATYHGLSIREDGKGLSAEIVFDL